MKTLPLKLFMYLQTAHSYFPLVGTKLDSQRYAELMSFSSNWIPTFTEVPETARQTS